MLLSRALRPLLAAALLGVATASPAWGGGPPFGAPHAFLGYSFGTPVIHHYGYHYQPRWYGYAPRPGWHGYRGYYHAPRPPRHWRHYDRHHFRGWAGRHPHHGRRWRR